MSLDWSRWPNFSAAEMQCRCGCGACDMSEAFMDALQTLRVTIQRPLVVTSGFRCAAHNEAVGGAPNSYHLSGEAADVFVHPELGRVIMGEADLFGGIGVGDNFLHLDVGPRRYWTY